MTFAELLASVTWPETKAALLWCHPREADCLEDYRKLRHELLQLTPAGSGMRIVIKEVYEQGMDDAPSTEVVGRDGTLNRELPDYKHFADRVDADYAASEANFGLSFTARAQWLGMAIDPATLQHCPSAQIVVHCLWDMTFHGFEEAQVQAVKEELNRRVRELDAMTEEEREKHLISWEEVRKNLTVTPEDEPIRGDE